MQVSVMSECCRYKRKEEGKMNINNEDIANQHVNDLRQELERCRLAQQTKATRNEAAGAAAGGAKTAGKWKALLDTIMMMGRRLL